MTINLDKPIVFVEEASDIPENAWRKIRDREKEEGMFKIHREDQARFNNDFDIIFNQKE